MDQSTFFGEARSLLAIQSERSFERLCAMIEAWPDVQERDDVLVPYLLGELRRWPSYLLHIPARWLPLCTSDAPPAFVALGQCLYMNETSPVGLLEALIQSPTRLRLRGLHFRALGVSARTLERLIHGAPIEMLELDGACSAQEALGVVEGLASRGVLKELFLTRLGLDRGALLDLVQFSGLSGLETLELSELSLDVEDVEGLAQAEVLRGLKSLYLRRTGVKAPAVEAIAAGRWRSLERMDLSRGRLAGASWRALEALPMLSSLVVDGCGLRAQDLDEMLSSGFSSRLTRWSVEDNGVSSPDAATWSRLERNRLERLHLSSNLFGDRSAQEIPWRALEQLNELRVGECALGEEGMCAVLEGVYRARISDLILWGNHGSERVARALWAKPWPVLRRLNLNRITFGPYLGELTLQHAQAPSLKSLKLYKAQLGDAGVAQLAQWTGAPVLETLSLAGNQLGDVGLKALAAGPLLSSVTELELVENRFRDPGFVALVKSPQLKSLKKLTVWGMPLGARAIKALIKSPLAARLESLDLNECRLNDGAVSALLQGSFERLEFLDLRSTYLGEQHAGQLGRARWPALRSLMLTESRLNASAFSAWLLAGAAQWEGLCVLGLGGNPIHDAGVELLQTVSWPQLHKLLLWDTGLTEAGARSLAQWEGLGRVAELNLNRNQIGAYGLKQLLNAPSLEALRALKLCSSRIGDGGLAQLVEHGAQRFNALNLSDNDFGERALVDFLSSDHMAGLGTLWCGWQRWGVRALRALTESAAMASLEELHLASSWLDDEAMTRIAGSEVLACLKTLELSTNQITTEGIRALVNSKSLTRLETLRLSYNRLDDEAVGLLASWPGLASITELKLDHNNISHEGILQLERSEFLRPTLRESLDVTEFYRL